MIEVKGKKIFLHDQKDYFKYINKKIFRKFQLSTDGGETILSKSEVFKLLNRFELIIRYLEEISTECSITDDFLEEVILNYKKPVKKFAKIMKRKFPDINMSMDEETGIISLNGLHKNKYHSLDIDEVFLENIKFIESLYDELNVGYIYYKTIDSDKFKKGTAGFVLNFIEKEVTPRHRTRFKGLGEMQSADLWDSTMNPETRSIIQFKTDDIQNAHEYFGQFMSDKKHQVLKRKKYMVDMAKQFNFDDIIEG